MSAQAGRDLLVMTLLVKAPLMGRKGGEASPQSLGDSYFCSGFITLQLKFFEFTS